MLINVCGVDVNARTSNGVTCLQTLVFNGSYDAIRFFTNAGADVNCLDDAGRSLLHHVLYNGDKVPSKRVVMLIAAGTNVDAKDRRGETAFERLVAQADPPRWLLPTLMAAGADLSALEPHVTADVTVDQVEAARRDIAKERLDFVRHRALQVCIGLQSLRIDALQMCEILQFACGPVASLIAFHQWWKIASTVKHFH